jgi:hypothetical protein
MQRWSDLTGKEPQLVFRDGEDLAA